MTPNIFNPTGGLIQTDEDTSNQHAPQKTKEEPSYKMTLAWQYIIPITYLHIAAIYGFYLMFTSARIYTTLWGYLLYILGGLGITAGVHRLWCHRAYKAKWPLRLILVTLNTLAFQDPIINWVQNHRLHHKYSDTDADPHNSLRGFFFSHVGWLFCNPHPLVISKGKLIDISDVYADPILRYQKKYYLPLLVLICFIIPICTPMYLWNESFVDAYSINLSRYIFTLNATWFVNSAAHIVGNKPYDRFINPTENTTVSILSLGEGWHNYHHTFPWDYRTAELGKYTFNLSTIFIDLMAKIGWAYDLKTVPTEMIQKRAQRTGDGTHNLWGWGDKDQSVEERNEAVIIYKHK